MAEPILSLDIFEPRYVAIGPPGARVNYELAHPGALNLVEQGRLARLMQRRNTLIQEMQRHLAAAPAAPAGEDEQRQARAAELLGWSEDADQQEQRERELSDLVHELVRMCLRAPEAVIRQLGDEAKGAILQAFTGPLPGTAARPAGATVAPVASKRARPRRAAQSATSIGESGSPA